MNTDKPKFVAFLVFVCITATFIKQISSFENVSKRDAILAPVAKQWIGTLRSGRRRQRKRRLKSEFAFFQSSLRLLQVTYFVKCKRTLLKLSSQEPHPSFERERKFRRRLCTSSVQGEIRHFHVVVVQRQQRNVQKSTCKIVVLLIKPIAFVTFPLPSPSSDLKFSNR